MYELPHDLSPDLSHNLRLTTLGNEEVLAKIQKKKTRRHSLMPSPRSKNKRLAMVQENWTKSAIKLSRKVLIYLISYIGLNILFEGL